MIRKLFFLLMCVGGFFLWTNGIQAAGGLSVSPVFQEVQLKNGDPSVSFAVTLFNQGTTPVSLNVSALDFGSLDESGGVAFLGASRDLKKKYTLALWMHPEKETVTLAPGMTETFSVTIENSDALAPGGHYGALLFQVAGENVPQTLSNSIGVDQLVSMLVFLKKTGGERYDLSLQRMESAHHFWTLPEVVRLTFHNDGNVHTVPRGTVMFADPLGRVVAKGVINEESGIVLPESTRQYPVRFLSLAWALLPGRYTLVTSYRYDGKDDFVVTTEYFELFPLPAIVVALMLAICLGWYGWRHRRNTGEKALSKGD